MASGSPRRKIPDTGVTVGRYQLVERIGFDGSIQIWRASREGLYRPVALRLVPHELLGSTDFIAEGRRLARLHHPNILATLDFGEHGPLAYVVTPLVNGLTLDHLLGEAWPIGEALLVLRPLAEAIDYAHDRGVPHGAIRPSNVLVTDHAQVILTGFSPLPREGASQVGDRQGLGRIAFELVLGRPPFEREVWPPELQPVPPSPLAPPCTLGGRLPLPVVSALFHAMSDDPAT